MDFCFVIGHYARDPEHRVALHHCVQSIRDVYGKDAKIHVIDDHSPIPLEWKGDDPNLQVHLNPWPRSGEVGVLYWYLHNAALAPESYAYCLHDSMICRKAVRPSSSCMLWSFDRAYGYHHSEIARLLHVIRHPRGDFEAWWRVFLEQAMQTWMGCFGLACFVARKDLQQLQDQHGFFDAMVLISTREDRQAMERIFGMFLCHTLRPMGSLCGSIFAHPDMANPRLGRLSYEEKQAAFPEYAYPFFKTWYGR